jgi:hypothetical protein
MAVLRCKMKRELKREYLQIMQELVDKNLNDIIFQPTQGIISNTNMLAINFGNRVEYSLHVFCFVRILQANNLLFTSSDEFFKADYTQISVIDNESGQYAGKSLLEKNIKNAKKLLKNAVITKVDINGIGDIFIEFDNEITIEITIDCMCENYEYYRFIKYADKRNLHYVVCFENGNIILNT